jgi:hypothetical protein
MRKIESLMVEAIKEALNWKQDNTEVRTDLDNVSHVYLHGNLIAKVGDDWLSLYDGGWRTNTTKSRINAVLAVHGNGERVYQKDHQWFIDIDGNPEPFKSGILLD